MEPPQQPVVAASEPGGVIYAADGEPGSLEQAQQIASLLGSRFQTAQPSLTVAGTVEHLLISAPSVGWAALATTTSTILHANSLNLSASLCYVARVRTLTAHVVAALHVHTLSELDGRRVNVGPNGSQNQIGAAALLDSAGVRVIPVYEHPESALRALAAGEIAAMVLLAEKPARALFAAQGVHLLALTQPLAGCIADTILPADYPLLGGGEAGRGTPVATLAVPLVLAGYDWPPGSAGFLATAQMADVFARTRSFDAMAADVEGWERFSPVATWISQGGRESVTTFANLRIAARRH